MQANLFSEAEEPNQDSNTRENCNYTEKNEVIIHPLFVTMHLVKFYKRAKGEKKECSCLWLKQRPMFCEDGAFSMFLQHENE